MGQAVIGALRVNLGLNSASFRSGLGKSNVSVQDFARRATVAFAAVGAAAAATFASALSVANDVKDKLAEAATAGLPFRDFQRLEYAAERSNVGVEALTDGIKELNLRADEFITTGAGSAAEAFGRLGFSAQELREKIRRPADFLQEIIDKLREFPEASRIRLADEIFGGTGGEQFVRFLRLGKNGIKELGDEAERLGLVMSGRVAASALVLTDNVTNLKKIFESFRVRLFNTVIPVLGRLTNKMIEIIRDGPKFDSLFRQIAGAMELLGRGVLFALSHLKDLVDLFKVFVVSRIITFVAGLAGSMLTLARTIRTAGIAMALVSQIGRAKITIILLLTAAIAKLTGTYDELVGWIGELGRTIMNSLPDSVRQGIDDVTSAIIGLGDEIEATDARAADSADVFLKAGAQSAAAFDKVGAKIKQTKKTLTDAEKEAKKFADTASWAFYDIGTSVQGLIKGTATWNDVLISVVQNFARIAAQQISAAIGESGGGILTTLAKSFLKGLTGFASGGSFEVGGTGGIDSQLVAFNASPNEVVSVVTPQQQREAANSKGGMTLNQTNNITIQTQDVRSFKQSEGQLAARLALLTQRGARNL